MSFAAAFAAMFGKFAATFAAMFEGQNLVFMRFAAMSPRCLARTRACFLYLYVYFSKNVFSREAVLGGGNGGNECLCGLQGYKVAANMAAWWRQSLKSNGKDRFQRKTNFFNPRGVWL